MDNPQAKRLKEAGQKVGEHLKEQVDRVMASPQGDRPRVTDDLQEGDELQEARGVNEAAQNFTDALIEFTEALMESQRTVADLTLEAQQFGMRLGQNFYNGLIEEFSNQAESNRTLAQDLARQAQRQQEAYRKLSEESVNAYMNFLNSMFSYYRGS